MSLLVFSSVGMAFGDRRLFSGVSFTVAEGERWGVVGRNGAGKTTLFRLVTGELAPTEGTVARRPGLRIGLLDQLRRFREAETVWQAAASGYRHLLDLERQLQDEAARLESLGPAAAETALARYDEALARFRHEGGYDYPARVDAVLQGLGMDPVEARRRPLSTLSGGELGRVGLAAQLSAPADLLLLDEPTNHLDLDAILWLKTHLSSGDRTLLFISHDRAFLDELATHILHLEGGAATPYRGGYSSFVAQHQQALLTQERRAAEQAKLVARLEDYIRRNQAGQKATQARSRRRILDRLPRLSPPPPPDTPMALRFDLSSRGGDQVLVAEDLTVGAGGRILVEGFSAVARRGEVIAVVGPNGCGKTTLLATLMGKHPPRKGRVRLGAGIVPVWFHQEHAHLPEGKSLYACVAESRPTWSRGQIQDHLGRFSFQGDEVWRTTDSLSGGERARAALALLSVQPANLLALDEPTNHLDVESVEALEDALEAFQGTVLVVSHDRALLRALATRVWAIRGGRLVDYPGSFADWEQREGERRQKETEQALAAQQEARQAMKHQARLERERLRNRERPLREARRQAERAEAEVHLWEARVAELEAALADPHLWAGPPAEASREALRLGRELEQAKRSLEAALDTWARATETIEELERGAGASP